VTNDVFYKFKHIKSQPLETQDLCKKELGPSSKVSLYDTSSRRLSEAHKAHGWHRLAAAFCWTLRGWWGKPDLAVLFSSIIIICTAHKGP